LSHEGAYPISILKGIVIFSLEIFAIIFAFYGVVALGSRNAELGAALMAAALVSGAFGFVLAKVTRSGAPDLPLEIHPIGRRTYQVDVDELRR
jgi:Zn-dependent protease with chaperone function